MKPENALISRQIFGVDQGRVVVTETWDLDHPDCPFVCPQAIWGSLQKPTGRYQHQAVMTKEEYAANPMESK